MPLAQKMCLATNEDYHGEKCQWNKLKNKSRTLQRQRCEASCSHCTQREEKKLIRSDKLELMNIYKGIQCGSVLLIVQWCIVVQNILNCENRFPTLNCCSPHLSHRVDARWDHGLDSLRYSAQQLSNNVSLGDHIICNKFAY